MAPLHGAVALPVPAAALTVRASLWVRSSASSVRSCCCCSPDGHLPSSRWRGLAWLSAGTLTACWTMIFLTPGTFADEGFPSVRNPFAVGAIGAVMRVAFPGC